jgi:hypothetical protein
MIDRYFSPALELVGLLEVLRACRERICAVQQSRAEND